MIAAPLTKTAAPHVVFISLDHSVIPFGTLLYDLTDNWPQFTSKFVGFCAFWGPELLDRTAYHLQTSEKTYRYNGAVVTQMRLYVTKLQSDWAEVINTLTYYKNC